MEIKKYVLSLSVVVGFLVSAVSQPTFLEGQDPKPEGATWQKNELMSDEFDGSSLNFEKWDDQSPQWKGRQPAYFSTNAVSVADGSLQITASKDLSTQEQNENPGYTMQGGLVRSITKATYGYYETRMKANTTFMSSTFWLINKRSEFTGCDNRVTELDVTENVGVNSGDPSRDWVNQNIVSINSNTHSRGVTGNPGCGIAETFVGGKTPIGEAASADYHIYGVWWKNATEMIFFLDGKQVHSVTPPADFDLGMYLRMVVETYDWNPPNPTLIDGLRQDGLDNSLEDRTTYYDWTRSWRLIDENTPVVDEEVGCHLVPQNLPIQTTFDIDITYVTGQDRDLVVELWKDDLIGQGTALVGLGQGTRSVEIDLDEIPELGSDYSIKASLRPVGGGPSENLETCIKEGIAIDTSSYNLLRNFDFETGDLSLWSSWGNVSINTDNQHRGSYGVTVEGAGAPFQIVPVKANTTYTLSAWSKVAQEGHFAYLGVKDHDAGESATQVDSLEYQRNSHTFTTGPNATSAQIYFYCPDAAYQVWGDDFELVEGEVALTTDTKEEKELLELDKLAKIFPNPVIKGQDLTIQALGQAPLEIKVYDVSGRIIKVDSTTTKEHVIASRVFDKAGIYFVHLIAESSSTVAKVLVVE